MAKLIIVCSIFFIVGKIYCLPTIGPSARARSEDPATEENQAWPLSTGFQGLQKVVSNEEVTSGEAQVPDTSFEKTEETIPETPGDVRWLSNEPCDIECLLGKLNEETATGKPKTSKDASSSAKRGTWGWGPTASVSSSPSKNVAYKFTDSLLFPPAFPGVAPGVASPGFPPSAYPAFPPPAPKPAAAKPPPPPPKPKPPKAPKPQRIVNFNNKIVRATYSPKIGKPKLKNQLLRLLFGVHFMNFAFVPKVLSPDWDAQLADMTFNPQLLHAVVSPQLLSPKLRTSLFNARLEPRLLNLRLVPQLLSPEINTNLFIADIRDPRGLELFLRPRALSPEINLQLFRYRPNHRVLVSLLQPSVLSPRVWLNLLAITPAQNVLSQQLNGGVLSPDIFASLNQGLLIRYLNGVGGTGFGSGDPIRFKPGK